LRHFLAAIEERDEGLRTRRVRRHGEHAHHDGTEKQGYRHPGLSHVSSFFAGTRPRAFTPHGNRRPIAAGSTCRARLEQVGR
jgi:hypothetical protein